MTPGCHGDGQLASVKADSRGWDWDIPGLGLRFRLMQGDGLSSHSKSKENVVPEGWLSLCAEGILP